MTRWLSLALISAVLLGGCAETRVDPENPESLYKDAQENIESDHFQIAIDKLRKIKNKFPYSKYAALSQLRIADVYFLQESFGEAAIAYETFTDLYPKHEKTPYARFRIAKSYFMDIPDTVARDMSSARKSLDAYATFLARHPQTEQSKEAQQDMKKVRETLAAKELYVGDFYFKREHMTAARQRYKKLVSLYPDTDSAEIARQRLGQIKEDQK